MARFMTLPSLLLVLSTLVLSTEARIPKHTNFKRQTSTAAHTNARGELELGQFETLDTCVEGCATYFNSLFESNSALRRNRRARQEAVQSLQDCEWVCSELHPSSAADDGSDDLADTVLDHEDDDQTQYVVAVPVQEEETSSSETPAVAVPSSGDMF